MDEYQQRITAIYGARADTYDHAPGNSDWHRHLAALLVQRAQLKQGQRVLDIATGTGLVAVGAAERVGPEGTVLGIDITASMLEQARRKVRALGLSQLRFEVANAEDLRLPEESFDHILCCAALVWMRDLPRTLAHWRTLLVPDGWIDLQTHPETALTTSLIVQQLAAAEGIDLRLHREVGTPERLHDLLKTTGFVDIDIVTEPGGYFMTLEQALILGPDFDYPTPGQYPSPLSACTNSQMNKIQQAYEDAMRAACTSQGIWLDCTSMFGRARREQ